MSIENKKPQISEKIHISIKNGRKYLKKSSIRFLSDSISTLISIETKVADLVQNATYVLHICVKHICIYMYKYVLHIYLKHMFTHVLNTMFYATFAKLELIYL